jgi:hypothetical protein
MSLSDSPNHDASVTLPSVPPRRRPNQLLRAALSGLMGLSVACDSDEPADTADPDEQEPNVCAPTGGKGGQSAADAGDQGGAGGRGEQTSSGMDEELDKEISTEDVQYAHSEVAKRCEERGGYIEVQGSCSGTATCKGFFYGDWEADSQLIEHSCSGSNGCGGFNCLIPKREGEPTKTLSGEEIMMLDDAWFLERAGQYGAHACRQCHIESMFDESVEDYVYDYTKLRMPVMAGSGRTNMETWLKRSADYQAKAVAFGVRTITEEGHVQSSMVPYAKLFSKQEIENVVEYMRKWDPSNVTFSETRKYPKP